MLFSKENTKLVTVAAVCLTAALVAPATAAVYDAVNADKVDGKHAVGADASGAKRKGKLVATSGTTGRLPNNIIAKAPNANKLDGVDSAAYRFIQLDPMSAYVSDATQQTGFGELGGVHMPDTGTPRVAASFIIPPDFTGDRLKLHLLMHAGQTGCTMHLAPDAVWVGHAGAPFNIGSGASDGLSDPGERTVPGTADNIFEVVYTLTSPEPQKALHRGDGFGFSLYRDTGDSCTGELVVNGMYVTY